MGYHGCDEKVANDLIEGKAFKASNNNYDWLGPGIYFWEANPQRGLDFAIELHGRKNSKIEKPAVVGAVIDLGLCLDLTTLSAIRMVEAAYSSLKESFIAANQQLPKNSHNLLKRDLDCAVIKRLHTILSEEFFPPVILDTIRGVFIEGSPVYPESGFFEKTHTQIAVRNPSNIKGVFRVPKDQIDNHS